MASSCRLTVMLGDDAQFCAIDALFYFCELTRLRIDDVTMQIDILWYERVGTDGINRISYRILGVVEALQPMV